MQPIMFANVLHLLHPALEQLTHVQAAFVNADQTLHVVYLAKHVFPEHVSADLPHPVMV